MGRVAGGESRREGLGRKVLKRCRERVGWVAELWDDIVETVALDATPGIESRMRKSWKTRS